MKYDALQKKLRKGGIKACLIHQHGNPAFSFYKTQKAKDGLHAINSCSKSITSMLIGICIREKLIPGIHTPIVTYFSDYLKEEKDWAKRDITLYHLLTMTSGLDWREFGEWNYWSPMEFSKNIVHSALERDLVEKPGTVMNYSSGSSNLLSAVIQKAAGMKTVDFAHRYLFGPLGIQEVQWHEKQGICLGANGLKMKAEDLVKLGCLYLQEGQWNSVQIVPKDWVQESTRPRFLTYEHIGHYGYQWWISDFADQSGENIPYYFALGLFGQLILVVPAYDMAVVFISENYSDTMYPVNLFKTCIAPLASGAA